MSGRHARPRAKKVSVIRSVAPVPSTSTLTEVTHRRPVRRALATVGAGLLVVCAGMLAGALPATAAAPALITGEACQPGEGVTVAVDYAPVTDEVQIGCAVGAQTDMAAAGAAAGFTFTTTPEGYLLGIGIPPETPVLETPVVALPNSFWSIYLNSSGGTPGGVLTTSWVSSNVGIDGGPLAVDSVLLFDLVPDWAAPVPDAPRITPAELGAPLPDYSTIDPPSYPASGDGDALAAAGWIGRQLEAAGGVLPGPGGGTDYGLTMDAIFALSAAGVGGDAIATAADALYQSGSDYIGAVVDSAANAGKIGKTVLALQVAGLDPTVFPDGLGGTRNLPEELRLAMDPGGKFGPNDFPLLHALIMFALDRTDGGVPPEAVTWLQDAQCTTAGPTQGGYGYSGCESVDIDNTSLAVQALLAADIAASDPSVAGGASWLAAAQQADGGLDSSFGENTNGTGLGGQAFLAVGSADAATAAAGFIGGLQVSCDSLEDGSLLTATDVGAIAYDVAGLQDGNDFGIDSVGVDQWRRASTQAILGLGLPAFDAITAAGADAALPAAATCDPVVPPEVTAPSTITSTTPATSSSAAAAVIATTGSGPQLSNTGATSATLPMTIAGLTALLVGVALVQLGRRTRGRHSD